MDELYQNLVGLTPKLKENLALYEERARNNVKVMTLVRDVPIDFTLEQMHMGGWNRQEVAAFFDRFEMNSMRQRYEKVMSTGMLGEAGAGGAIPESSAKTSAKKIPPAKALKSAASLDEIMRGEGQLAVTVIGTRIAVANEVTRSFVCVNIDEFI